MGQPPPSRCARPPTPPISRCALPTRRGTNPHARKRSARAHPMPARSRHWRSPHCRPLPPGRRRRRRRRAMPREYPCPHLRLARCRHRSEPVARASHAAQVPRRCGAMPGARTTKERGWAAELARSFLDEDDMAEPVEMEAQAEGSGGDGSPPLPPHPFTFCTGAEPLRWSMLAHAKGAPEPLSELPSEPPSSRRRAAAEPPPSIHRAAAEPPPNRRPRPEPDARSVRGG